MQGFTPRPVNQKAVQDEEPSRGITNGSARKQRKLDEIYSLHGANKKLSYRRVTARCVLSVVIVPITTQQCRNYFYDKF